MNTKQDSCILPIKLLILLITLVIHYNSFSQKIDYSSYEIAKVYKSQKNLVLTYKYLIIFKYANIERLKTPENVDALHTIDQQITSLEAILNQNFAWYKISQVRGFSDKQIDSSLIKQEQKIILNEIRIK